MFTKERQALYTKDAFGIDPRDILHDALIIKESAPKGVLLDEILMAMDMSYRLRAIFAIDADTDTDAEFDEMMGEDRPAIIDPDKQVPSTAPKKKRASKKA